MKKSIIYILLAITFILAVAAIVPWVFIGYGVYKVADTSEKVSDAIEKALDTPSKGLSKNNMTESDNSYSMNSDDKQRCIITYSQILDRFVNERQSDEYMDEQYFLFDITGDGIPELWLEVTDWEGEYFHLLYVYTISDGQLELLYKGNAGHPSHHAYFMGNDYILLDYSHMGSIARYKYFYNGKKIIQNELFNCNETDANVQGYTELTESGVVTSDITDKELLNSI